jgi:hypothetical protein
MQTPMKSANVVISLFLCATLLTSCTRAILLQVFNNTRERLTVVSYEHDLKEKHYSIDAHQSARVEISNRLTITRENTVWEYDVKPVPKRTTYMTSERFGPLLVKLQVEQNGVVYILSPEAQGVMTNPPPQPPGYPIQPKSK